MVLDLSEKQKSCSFTNNAENLRVGLWEWWHKTGELCIYCGRFWSACAERSLRLDAMHKHHLMSSDKTLEQIYCNLFTERNYSKEQQYITDEERNIPKPWSLILFRPVAAAHSLSAINMTVAKAPGAQSREISRCTSVTIHCLRRNASLPGYFQMSHSFPL